MFFFFLHRKKKHDHIWPYDNFQQICQKYHLIPEKKNTIPLVEHLKFSKNSFGFCHTCLFVFLLYDTIAFLNSTHICEYRIKIFTKTRSLSSHKIYCFFFCNWKKKLFPPKRHFSRFLILFENKRHFHSFSIFFWYTASFSQLSNTLWKSKVILTAF